jgi:hypothetical protein
MTSGIGLAIRRVSGRPDGDVGHSGMAQATLPRNSAVMSTDAGVIIKAIEPPRHYSDAELDLAVAVAGWLEANCGSRSLTLMIRPRGLGGGA